MVAVHLVVQLEPMVAQPPIIADPRHAIHDQGFDIQRTKPGGSGDAGMPATHNQYRRIAVCKTRALSALIQPIRPVEFAFEGGLLTRFAHGIHIKAAQAIKCCGQHPSHWCIA